MSFLTVFVFTMVTFTDFLWMLKLTTFYFKSAVANIVKFTPDTFKNPLKLATNYFPLVRGINKCISYLMTKSCSRSTFGSINKHVGITVKGKNWKLDAWEGFNPAKPSSIIKCSKLTPPLPKEKVFFSYKCNRKRGS